MNATGTSNSRFDFDQIAERYDRWYSSRSGIHFDKVEKRAIDKMLPPQSDKMSLLEIGCGTGHWSSYFSSKGFEVTGIDMSPGMINIAEQKKIPKCKFGVGDCENIPFDNDTFDVAAAITSLEFTAHPEKIVQEMVRCVKKDGGLLILGVLNSLSRYNCKKMIVQGSVYSAARMLSLNEIKSLVAPYRISRVCAAGFYPKQRILFWMAPLYEYIGCLVSNEGAFIAVRIDV